MPPNHQTTGTAVVMVDIVLVATDGADLPSLSTVARTVDHDVLLQRSTITDCTDVDLVPLLAS